MAETRPDCRCGHPATWHDHYRDGDDCGCCTTCRSYQRPRTTLRDLLWRARVMLALWRTRR